jgi:hypothetical protein
MEKKLITEMKFMMERLENPRMTYTEYEKKHKVLTEGPTVLPPRPSSDRPPRPSSDRPFRPSSSPFPGMNKSSHQEKLPDSFNKFIKTNFETLSKPYSDPSELPSELKNIKYKFLGSSKNYAITEDGNQYNVYSWTRIYDIDRLGSFGSEEEAKKSILKNNN